MDLIEELKKNFNRSGLTYEQFSKKINIERAMLSKLINRKKKPAQVHIEKIEKYLKSL